MKKVKTIIQYILLVVYLFLIAVLIIEASLPGEVSASHGSTVSTVIQDVAQNVQNVVDNVQSAIQEATQEKNDNTNFNSGNQSVDNVISNNASGGGIVSGGSSDKIEENISSVNGEQSVSSMEKSSAEESSAEQKPDILERWGTTWQEFNSFIRKSVGHFGAFLVLALVGTVAIFMFSNDKTITATLSLSVGAFVAMLTEIIQLFVPGRYGLFKDFLLDFVGYVSGFTIAVVVLFCVWLWRKKQRNN